MSALLFDKEGRNLSPGHSFCNPFGSPFLWLAQGSASKL